MRINIRISKFYNWLQIGKYRICLSNSIFGFHNFKLEFQKLKYIKQNNSYQWYEI